MKVGLKKQGYFYIEGCLLLELTTNIFQLLDFYFIFQNLTNLDNLDNFCKICTFLKREREREREREEYLMHPQNVGFLKK
jgi:hypothetical protein